MTSLNYVRPSLSWRGLRMCFKRALLLSCPQKSYGGAKRDRTADLYNAIVALSQLSYSPLLPCPASNAPIEGVAKTPVSFQFVQCQNTAGDVYRRGNTLRKQIFIWRRVFLHHRRQTSGICIHQEGKIPIDHPYHLGWAIIRRRR